MDRSASGLSDFTQYFTGRTTAPMKTTDGRVTLRVYVDSSSVEAFGADGQAAVTSLIFPGPDADGMAFYAKGGTAHIDSLKVHKLDSTYRLVDRAKPLAVAPACGEFRSDLGNLTITPMRPLVDGQRGPHRNLRQGFQRDLGAHGDGPGPHHPGPARRPRPGHGRCPLPPLARLLRRH